MLIRFHASKYKLKTRILFTY